MHHIEVCDHFIETDTSYVLVRVIAPLRSLLKIETEIYGECIYTCTHMHFVGNNNNKKNIYREREGYRRTNLSFSIISLRAENDRHYQQRRVSLCFNQVLRHLSMIGTAILIKDIAPFRRRNENFSAGNCVICKSCLKGNYYKNKFQPPLFSVNDQSRLWIPGNPPLVYFITKRSNE